MAIDKDSYLSWLGFETMWKKITNSFAKKSTTIGGYGITDAYTKKEVDDEISRGVESVEVGGRNLLREGEWNNITKTAETYLGNPVYSATYKDGTFTDITSQMSLIGKLRNKGSYTISFYAKASIAITDNNYTLIGHNFYNIYQNTTGYLTSTTKSSWGYVGASADGTAKNISLTTSWKKYYITWKLKDTVPENSGVTPSLILFRIFKAAAGVTIYFSSVKLENGAIATDWTPAPEDIYIDINERLDKSGDTMTGNLDMGDYAIENCQSITMTGDIDMNDAGGINNCTYIGGSGDNDTIEFQSKIDATGYGFWDGQKAGTDSNIVLGDGSFKDIRTEIYTSDGIYSYDDKIPTSEAVYDCIVNKIGDSSIEHITYSNLKTLRDNSGLLPGKWYRITDYKTTTNTTNTQSANHVFDILVMAVYRNALSEIAFVTKNASDTYFSSCELQAWELRYCLDNDKNRFAWALNTAEGRGVIYYMKDEYNNEAPYDFKNIQFKDYLVNETANTPANVYKAVGNDGNSENMNLLLSFNSAYRYTFATTSGADSSLNRNARNNRIEPYFAGTRMHLNFITMSSGSIYGMNFGKNCHNITIEASSSLSDNAFNGANNFIYIKCKSFYDNIFDKEAFQISICGNYASSSSSNIWANYFGPQSAYIALVLQSHVRCLNFMSRNQNICLYGVSAQCIQFGEQAMYISWIEQATFAAAKASVSYSGTPSRLNTTGYFLHNRFMAGSEGISIGIPFLFSCDFGCVKYMALNKQSSATYSFKTPTHWLDVSVGDYGSSSAYKVITPPNNSTSQVFIHKTNAQTLTY